MTNNQKMTTLMARLRVEMNGVVVDTMRDRGIVYPMSFGVSVPTIRELSAEYAPDHRLATLLWRQSVRELQLAALTIAQPESVSVEELEFWGGGVANIELAEHLATLLLCRTQVVEQVIKRWLLGESVLLQYTALLTITRQMMIGESKPEWSWEEVLDRVIRGEEALLRSSDRFVWQGLGLFMGRLLDTEPGSKEAVKSVMERAKEINAPLAKHLESELGWRYYEGA